MASYFGRLSQLLCGLSLLLFLPPAESKSLPVFAIVRNNELGKIQSLENAQCIKGITLYWSWRALEPQKGVYNFQQLEQVLGQLAKSKMKVNLAILPGRWSPDWLKAEGAQYMYWAHADSYVENGKLEQSSAPVPWDDVYLTNFERFFERLIPKIKKYDNILAFSVTGPSNTNGLEAALVGNDEELRRIGFSPEVFVGAWLRMARKVNDLGGAYKLTVALHERFGSQRIPGIGRDLDGKLRSILGARYVPMLLGFEGKSWFSESNGYAGLIVKNGRGNGAVQAIRRYSGSEGRAGLKASVQKAASLDVEWYEVWADDVVQGLLDCDDVNGASR